MPLKFYFFTSPYDNWSFNDEFQGFLDFLTGNPSGDILSSFVTWDGNGSIPYEKIKKQLFNAIDEEDWRVQGSLVNIMDVKLGKALIKQSIYLHFIYFWDRLQRFQIGFSYFSDFVSFFFSAFQPLFSKVETKNIFPNKAIWISISFMGFQSLTAFLSVNFHNFYNV